MIKWYRSKFLDNLPLYRVELVNGLYTVFSVNSGKEMISSDSLDDIMHRMEKSGYELCGMGESGTEDRARSI